MMVYTGTKFHENILDVISYKEDRIFIRKISKGHNSVKKKVDGVSVLVLCTLSGDALHLY